MATPVFASLDVAFADFAQAVQVQVEFSCDGSTGGLERQKKLLLK